MMVASAMGRFPQSLGPAWLVAERVIQAYDPASRYDLIVTDIAAIKPLEADDSVLNMANAMHRRYGVRHQLNATELSGFMCGIAVTSLVHLRTAAMYALRYTGQNVPVDVASNHTIMGDEVNFQTMRLGLIGPWSFNPTGARALDAFLRRDEAMRKTATKDIRVAAKDVKARSRAQQAQHSQLGILGRGGLLDDPGFRQ